MSDYLTSLTLRNLNLARGIRPRVPMRFEPRNRKVTLMPAGWLQNPAPAPDRTPGKPSPGELPVEEIWEDRPAVVTGPRPVVRTVVRNRQPDTMPDGPLTDPEGFPRQERPRERQGPGPMVASEDRPPAAARPGPVVTGNDAVPREPAVMPVSPLSPRNLRSDRERTDRERPPSPGKQLPPVPGAEQPSPVRTDRETAPSPGADTRARRHDKAPVPSRPARQLGEPGRIPAPATGTLPREPLPPAIARAEPPVPATATGKNRKSPRRPAGPTPDDITPGGIPLPDRTIRDRERHPFTVTAGHETGISAAPHGDFRQKRETRGQKIPEKEPRVQVTIGRIEIRSLTTEDARKQQAGPPALNIDDYLRHRAKRSDR